METKKIKISIGIPAYNEAGNIARLLESLIAQKLNKGKLLYEIIVISDGSTDKTVLQARTIKNKKIKVIAGQTRKGKSERLNEIFSLFKGDYLVLLDADIQIQGAYVINSIVQSFLKKTNVGFVAGNAMPMQGETIYEKAMNNFINSLDFIKRNINHGNNVFSVRGPITALSQPFAKSLQLPNNVPDDRFTYFSCIQKGFNFVYSENAVVFFKSPQTLEDQITQCFRFKKDRENLEKVVNHELLSKEHFIPFKLKVAALFLQLKENPIAYFVMKFIQLQVLFQKSQENKKTWRIVRSTKIFYEK